MQIKRRDFLKGIGAAAGTLAFPDTARAAAKRPNVVLLMTDDQGYGDLGCHGNPAIDTPNLDALHAESLRLTNFHVCPTCTPTRAALLTGRYSIRTGVWHTIMGRSIMRRDEVTMADVFSSQGYRTGIFGKWHLGDNYPYRPQDRGFGEVLVHGGGGVGQAPDYWGNDYFDDTYFHNGVPERQEGYCTDVWFDAALRFIEANKDRPFFAYIPTNAPHSPYNVAAKYSGRYRGKDVVNPEFYGMITNIDENVGRLLSALKRLGLEENTIFIFLTDNGSAGGARKDKQGFIQHGYNAGMRGMKGMPYDGGHRVPCFIRWPGGGLGGGRNIQCLTAHMDLLPTIIELCGLDAPKEVAFDGRNLTPLLTGDTAAWPGRTIVVDQQRIDHPEKWRNSVVMTERWRLIRGKELFDIHADPEQKRDLAKDHSEVLKKLREAYEGWWADTSKRFDEYSDIVAGSEQENPARLCCMDWHGPKIPWNQDAVRRGLEANGFWAIEVARAGTYEIALRRWPEEANLAIDQAEAGAAAINITEARLSVGDAERSKAVAKGDLAATFTLDLKPGKTRLQTWLTDDTGVSRGAYYVYVKRVI